MLASRLEFSSLLARGAVEVRSGAQDEFRDVLQCPEGNKQQAERQHTVRVRLVGGVVRERETARVRFTQSGASQRRERANQDARRHKELCERH